MPRLASLRLRRQRTIRLARVGALGLRFAFRDADPVGALNALGRGLVIAQDSGNRNSESHLAMVCARLEAEHGDPCRHSITLLW